VTATAYVGKSGSGGIDGILSGSKWAVNHLTYSFPTSPSYYSYSGERDNNFGVFNSSQKAAVQHVLRDIAAVTGLSFSQTTETSTNHATLRYAFSDSPSAAWAYYPSTGDWGGDAWYNKSQGYFTNSKIGGWAYVTYIHETGHALGLKHGHESESGFPKLPSYYDSSEFSVMTYHDFIGQNLSTDFGPETWGFPQSLMMFDIAALQYLYGPNFNFQSGNTVYTFSPTAGTMFINGTSQGQPGGNKIFRTIWDGNGNDTYKLSNYSDDLKIDLRPGHWSTFSKTQIAKIGTEDNGTDHFARGNVANAWLYKGDQRSLIENAIGGSGDDDIAGNQARNYLHGNGGNDRIWGFNSNDTLLGASGRDSLIGNAGWDRLDGASDADTLKGGSGNDTLAGGSHNDRLLGEAGNDLIYGGYGNDDLYGGNGNDKLYGNDGNDDLYGGNGHDTIQGANGNDRVIGGAGNDAMNGGAGADDFIIWPSVDNDKIYGFAPNIDDIDIRGASAPDSFAELNITNVGGNAVIALGGGTITLIGISKAALDAGDFIF